jgi:hypothetical protein
VARTRLVALAALVAAMTALVVPAPSQAQQLDSLACTFSATTNQLTGIPSILRDVTTGNGAGVESGTYSFASAPLPGLVDTTLCLHIDADTGANDTGLYRARIAGDGTYHNLLCGTGTTDGNAILDNFVNVLTGGPDTGIDDVSFNYHVDFVGGQGVGQTIADLSTNVAGVTVGSTSTATKHNAPHPDRNILGAGTIHIIGRSNLIPCVTDDVTAFEILGTLAGVF